MVTGTYFCIILAYSNWYWYLFWIIIAYSNWYWYLFWNVFALSNWYWHLFWKSLHSQTGTGTCSIFPHYQTGTVTSYLYRLHFKGAIGLEILMCSLQYWIYLNKSVQSVMPVWSYQLVIGSYEIVKPISSFYCYFFLSCPVLNMVGLYPP